MRLIVCRHAARQDTLDENWIYTSATPYDPPLSRKGEQQADALGKRLERSLQQDDLVDGPICIISSPFTRCVQTAAAIAGRLNAVASINLAPGLGEWLTPDYFTRCLPPPEDDHVELSISAKRWLAENAPRKQVNIVPGSSGEYGEPWLAMKTRVSEALENMLLTDAAVTEAATVIVVTHGACCNALYGHLSDSPALTNVELASFFSATSTGDGWEISSNENRVVDREYPSSHSSSSSSLVDSQSFFVSYNKAPSKEPKEPAFTLFFGQA